MANEAYHTREYYRQQRAMLVNGDPRALILFCVDVSKSMDEWWIEDGGLMRNTGTRFSDGHNVETFRFSDIRPGYAYYQKIQKLNDVLSTLLNDFKRDPDIRDKVAVSIVAYSQYGKVVYDFLDCAELDVESCKCKVDRPETAMGDGIRTALHQIDEMENDMRQAGNDAYTPILVFMTDGMPTDEPRKEFEEIRKRVEKEDLYIFPLGIGDGADMNLLREMYPMGMVPQSYSQRYKMVEPDSYDKIFKEIKSYVKAKNIVMVSEGNSVQSAPATEDVNVLNNQMGESMDLRLFFDD